MLKKYQQDFYAVAQCSSGRHSTGPITNTNSRGVYQQVSGPGHTVSCGQVESDGDEAQDRLPDPRSSALGLCCCILVLVLLRGQPFNRSVACCGALLGNGKKKKNKEKLEHEAGSYKRSGEGF